MAIIGVIFRDAIASVPCERCEAEAGEPCNDGSRAQHPLGTLHVVRLHAYQEARRKAGLHQEVTRDHRL